MDVLISLIVASISQIYTYKIKLYTLDAYICFVNFTLIKLVEKKSVKLSNKQITYLRISKLFFYMFNLFC